MIKIPIEAPSTLICKADRSKKIMTLVASIVSMTIQENKNPDTLYKGISLDLMIPKMINQLVSELIKEGLIDHIVNIRIVREKGKLPEIHYSIGDEDETD